MGYAGRERLRIQRFNPMEVSCFLSSMCTIEICGCPEESCYTVEYELFELKETVRKSSFMTAEAG